MPMIPSVALPHLHSLITHLHTYTHSLTPLTLTPLTLTRSLTPLTYTHSSLTHHSLTHFSDVLILRFRNSVYIALTMKLPYSIVEVRFLGFLEI